MPTATPDRKCPYCGAKVGRQWRSCWLCGKDLPAASPEGAAAPIFIDEEGEPGSTRETVRLLMKLVGLFMAATLVLILVGMLANGEFGGAIFLVLLFLPAGIVTLSKSLSQRAQGETLTPMAQAGTFLMSLAVTIGVIVALGVAAFVALLVACFAILASGGGGSNMFR